MSRVEGRGSRVEGRGGRGGFRDTQTYQYISCVHCITVQLYSFENHILVITQQFLVLHGGVQQQTQAAYQKSMLVVTATS